MSDGFVSVPECSWCSREASYEAWHAGSLIRACDVHQCDICGATGSDLMVTRDGSAYCADGPERCWQHEQSVRIVLGDDPRGRLVRASAVAR